MLIVYIIWCYIRSTSSNGLREQCRITLISENILFAISVKFLFPYCSKVHREVFWDQA